MSDYTEQMEELAYRMNDAMLQARVAFNAADNEDGAPAADLKKIKVQMERLADDVECLLDYNCTRAEIRDAEALYKGAKLAGLTGR